MTIKKIAVASSIILTFGLSLTLFAESHKDDAVILDGDVLTIECIPQREVDAMELADREKLTIPICEDIDEGMERKKAQQQ